MPRAADGFLMGLGHALVARARARFGIDRLLPQARVHWHRARRRDVVLPFVATGGTP